MSDYTNAAASLQVQLPAVLTKRAGYTSALAQLVDDQVASEIFALNATLWGPAAETEARVRLGWTDVAPAAAELLPVIDALRETFAAQGVNRFVLCGMGGSSLGPAVIAQWADIELTMLDSTAPAAVARALDGDLARTAVIVSSKSGNTIETRSHLDTFEAAFTAAGITAGDRVVIVTDPGSPLESESRAAGRNVVLADPNVGGRFSVLTAFGLVPAGLAGADVAGLVAAGTAVTPALAQNTPENPALQLAAAIYAGLPERFVLAVTEDASARWGLGRWAEQLVAESTGKDGLGVLPIALPDDAPELENVPASAVVVRVTAEADGSTDATPDSITVAGNLGAQFLLWEVATAALGRLMQIDPFNQPDVESAKIAARAALAEAEAATDATTGEPVSPAIDAGSVTVLAAPAGVAASTAAEIAVALRELTPTDGYLAVQAFLDPQGALRDPLERLRTALARALNVPVSLGYGPSFLHSVGQLHKGGPAQAAFLQVTDPDAADLAIAKSETSFGTLIGAQAGGDRTVLIERGRPVIAIALAQGDSSVIEQLITELGA